MNDSTNLSKSGKLLGVPFDVLRALGGYCLVAVAFLWPLIPKLATHIVADDSFGPVGTSDAYNSLWTYWWVQKAILTGQNILHCNWVLPPTGADLTFHATSIVPTILSLPVDLLFGTVVGYNLMVAGLLVSGALCYYVFISRTFDFSKTAAFVGGLLFGLCPYFLSKAHAHTNLIGGLIWGGALGIVCNAYVTSRFSLRKSILFALFFGLTIWTSFVELYMLSIVLGISVVVFESFRWRDSIRERGKRLLFFAPTAFTLIPLWFVLRGVNPTVVVRDVFPTLPSNGLITFPKLSVLSAFSSAQYAEYWGVYLPFAVVLLAAVGCWKWRQIDRETVIQFLILAIVCLVLTTDLDRYPNKLLRLLPLGSGFRVFSRFLPFLMFFLGIIACRGIDTVRGLPGKTSRWVVVTLLCVIGLLEYYPARLNAAAVKSFPLTADVRGQLDRSKFVLVVTKDEYANIDDTYQVALDMPFVHLSVLSREDSATIAKREQEYPHIYGSAEITDLREAVSELQQLNIRYLIVEGAYDTTRLPQNCRIIARQNGALLADISASP